MMNHRTVQGEPNPDREAQGMSEAEDYARDTEPSKRAETVDDFMTGWRTADRTHRTVQGEPSADDFHAGYEEGLTTGQRFDVEQWADIRLLAGVVEDARRAISGKGARLARVEDTLFQREGLADALNRAQDRKIRELNLPRRSPEPQGEPSDAAVRAALHVFFDQDERTGYEWRDGLMYAMRAALKAAATVGTSDD